MQDELLPLCLDVSYAHFRRNITLWAWHEASCSSPSGTASDSMWHRWQGTHCIKTLSEYWSNDQVVPHALQVWDAEVPKNFPPSRVSLLNWCAFWSPALSRRTSSPGKFMICGGKHAGSNKLSKYERTGWKWGLPHSVLVHLHSHLPLRFGCNGLPIRPPIK